MASNSENIGPLRHRVQVWSSSITRNAAGENLRTWSLLVEAWASIEYRTQGSDESEQLNQTGSTLNARVKVRYRSTWDTEMKLVFDSKQWNIRSILPDANRTYMELECEYFDT